MEKTINMIPIKDEYQEVESCLYKLYYGDRYLIVKGKTLAGSLYLISKGYAAFISSGGGKGKGRGHYEMEGGQKEWGGTNTYYMKFYIYVHENPGLEWRVDVILESNSPYRLLKREYQELNVYIHDKKCLNSNVEAYVPKFSEKSGMYGWIPKRNVADFRRYVNKWA